MEDYNGNLKQSDQFNDGKNIEKWPVGVSTGRASVSPAQIDEVKTPEVFSCFTEGCLVSTAGVDPETITGNKDLQVSVSVSNRIKVASSFTESYKKSQIFMPVGQIETSGVYKTNEYAHESDPAGTEDLTDGPCVYQSTTTPLEKRSKAKLQKKELKSTRKVSFGSTSSLESLVDAMEQTLEACGSSEKLTKEKNRKSAGLLTSLRRLCDSVRDVNFSRRQWAVAVVIALVTLTSSFAVCLFPPFFPELAQRKGASTSVFGVIIGTNCLVAFLVTPPVGKNLEKFGVKFSFVMGALASGVCCILSGFLELFPAGWEFIFEAILIRAIHATSNAFVITSTFAFIVVEFPDNIAKLFAMTRAAMNLAQMLGPVVGGALYELGGFKLPFLVLGAVQIWVALFSIYALPHYRKKEKASEETSTAISLKDVVRIPGMWISFCIFIFSTMSNGFLTITLEAWVLRKFSISHLHVGFLFGLKDGANSLASPLWGCLCDRIKSMRPVIIMSTLIATVSFVLIGPFPGLPFSETHTLVIIALLINGIGIGGQQVSGVVHAMKMTKLGSLPDDATTHGFIAGLWSSLSGAGRFVSRAGSGFVADQIGYRNATMVVVFLQIIIFIVTGGFVLCDHLGCRWAADKLPKGESQTGTGKRSPDSCSTCRLAPCVCEGGRHGGSVTVFGTCTPSDPVSAKAVSIPIGGLREDLEDSFVYNSWSRTPCTPSFARRSGTLSSVPDLPTP